MKVAIKALPVLLLSASPLLALALGSGCSTESQRPAPVLLIGVDGLEWDVLLPLLQRGELPNMQGLMERGSYGRLATSVPTASPVLWTSIATGKRLEQHGIESFARKTEHGYELYDNSDRRTKALWNIASDYDLEVAIIGWWMTFPVEPVRGLMVAQTNSISQADVSYGKNIWKGGLLPEVPGQVYPPALEANMVRHAEAARSQLEQHLLETYGSFPHPLSPLEERLWEQSKWSFQADTTYLRIATEALSSGPHHDLVCVYFGSPDVVGHRFWRYYRPEDYLHRPGTAELENMSTILEDTYRWVDRAVGQLLAACRVPTRILLISDHGMHAFNRAGIYDKDEIPINVASGHHQDAPPGVIVTAGPDLVDDERKSIAGLVASELPEPASIYDVARTVLLLLNLPMGADMEGSAALNLIEPAFLRTHPLREIATHDTPEFVEARARLAELSQGVDTDERLKQLRELGYIGADSTPTKIPPSGSQR